MYTNNLENRVYTLSAIAEHISHMEAHASDVKEGLALTAIAGILADTYLRLEDALEQAIEGATSAAFLSAYRKNNSADWKEQKDALEQAKVSNATVKRVRTVLKAPKFWKFLSGVEILKIPENRTTLNILEMFAAHELTASKLQAFAPRPRADGPTKRYSDLIENIVKLETASDKEITLLRKQHETMLKAIEALAKRSEVKQAA